MSAVRDPAVAGLFYPADADELRQAVRSYLESAGAWRIKPKALIAPHAGYDYSGPIAGTAYAQLSPLRQVITRVVLVGPSHRAAFRGLATSSAESFATPLGRVPVDQQAVSTLLTFPHVRVGDAAHGPEHSLEVHLPFLQQVLDHFALVPLLVGEATASEVSQPLESLWGGAETLLVVSSDLSHFHDYETARRLDRDTSDLIEQLSADIGPQQACGCRAIGGLLRVARSHGLQAKTMDLRNSGDTAGPRHEVVGYGAYVLS